jgi:hypothetical protein
LETVIVFIDNYQSPSATPYEVASSGHGDFQRIKTPQRRSNNINTEYFTSFGKSHEL